MVLNYRLFQTQRAQELPGTAPQAGLPQRRVWDINWEYVKSPVFYIKFAELVSQFTFTTREIDPRPRDIRNININNKTAKTKPT